MLQSAHRRQRMVCRQELGAGESTRELGRLAPPGTSLTECDQSAALLVVELQPHALYPVPQRQPRDLAEDWVGVVRPLQVVVGDPGREVVDVVQANVAGENCSTFGSLR